VLTLLIIFSYKGYFSSENEITGKAIDKLVENEKKINNPWAIKGGPPKTGRNFSPVYNPKVNESKKNYTRTNRNYNRTVSTDYSDKKYSQVLEKLNLEVANLKDEEKLYESLEQYYESSQLQNLDFSDGIGVQRTLSSEEVAPGETLTVTLTTKVGGSNFYIIEEYPPSSTHQAENWDIVSDGGGASNDFRILKWAIYKNVYDRTITYTIKAPETPGSYYFEGYFMLQDSGLLIMSIFGQDRVVVRGGRCSEMSPEYDECSYDEYCPSGVIIAASDTERCCSVTCETSSCVRCSDCNQGTLDECTQSKCENQCNGQGPCLFLNYLEPTCVSCSGASCASYGSDYTACFRDICNFNSCQWNYETEGCFDCPTDCEDIGTKEACNYNTCLKTCFWDTSRSRCFDCRQSSCGNFYSYSDCVSENPCGLDCKWANNVCAEDTIRISGNVFSHNGRDLPGIKLDFYYSYGKITYRRNYYTDEYGGFVIEGIPYGAYAELRPIPPSNQFYFNPYLIYGDLTADYHEHITMYKEYVYIPGDTYPPCWTDEDGLQDCNRCGDGRIDFHKDLPIILDFGVGKNAGNTCQYDKSDVAITNYREWVDSQGRLHCSSDPECGQDNMVDLFDALFTVDLANGDLNCGY
jgi:hypothetical protein